MWKQFPNISVHLFGYFFPAFNYGYCWGFTSEIYMYLVWLFILVLLTGGMAFTCHYQTFITAHFFQGWLIDKVIKYETISAIGSLKWKFKAARTSTSFILWRFSRAKHVKKGELLFLLQKFCCWMLFVLCMKIKKKTLERNNHFEYIADTQESSTNF